MRVEEPRRRRSSERKWNLSDFPAEQKRRSLRMPETASRLAARRRKRREEQDECSDVRLGFARRRSVCSDLFIIVCILLAVMLISRAGAASGQEPAANKNSSQQSMGYPYGSSDGSGSGSRSITSGLEEASGRDDDNKARLLLSAGEEAAEKNEGNNINIDDCARNSGTGLPPISRHRRWLVPGAGSEVEKSGTGNGDSITRIVALAGQWIELQCPLASELLASSSSSARASPSAPEHTIVWRKNGLKVSQLSPRQRVSGHNGTLLMVSAQPKLDEGSYECALVESSKEQPVEWAPLKSHKFQLSLLVAPRLAPFEFPAGAQVGMKVVLTCSALEGQQPISFLWLKDNQVIQNSLGGSAHSQQNSLGQLHQQQLADKLSLSAGLSMASSAGGLYTLAGQKQQQEYVVLGGELPGAKSAFGTAPEASEANLELLPLLSEPNVRVRQSDDYSILSIEHLELKHSGRYTCSAQNGAARVSHSSQLLINAPPSITIEPKDAELVAGQSSVIECAASGQPRPTISWLRARESSNKVWDYLPVYDNLRYTTLENGSLLISNVTQREQGYYLCSARNGFGPEVSKLIKINVHEPARFSAKYKTLEVRIEERVNMLCLASGEPPVSIEWLDKDSNVIQKNDKKFIIDSEPGELAELNAGENGTLSRLILTKSSRADSGHYTCKANNKFGSDKMVTNLLVQDVPDKVAELKVVNVTASSVSLRWQLSFTGNARVTSYLVQYQSDDPLDDLLMNSHQLHSSAGSQKSASFANGDPGSGSVGGEHLDKQLSILESLRREQHQAKSATSSLKAALEALGSAGAAGSADEAVDRTLVELTVEQSATSLLVKELEPFCVYRLRLAAVNKIGLGEFSDWIRFKTEEAPPSGSALKMAATATGPNSIKLSWLPPDRRSWNGQLVGFNIGYRPLDSSFEFNKTVEWTPPSFQSIAEGARAAEPKPAGNSSREPLQDSMGLLRQQLRQLLALQQQELVAHLTNLQRSTSYLVWMQAINKRGLGPQSHAISVKTLEDVPPSAPALRVQSTGANSITIGWSLLSNFVSPTNQYSLFYRRLAAPLQPPVPPLASPPGRPFQPLGAQPAANLTDQQPAGSEPAGPFIERTISSQLLLNSVFPGFTEGQFGPSQPSHSSQQQQQFVYTLDQLECGSSYELYMITRNSVGKSEPSSVLTTRTLGEPPQAPANKNNLFSRISSNEVALNLAAWSTGGCPLTHMSVRYKQAPFPVAAAAGSANNPNTPSNQPNLSSATLSISWPVTTSVPASIISSLNGQQRASAGQLPLPGPGSSKLAEPVYSLKSLAPNTCYELELVAYNAAGHTSAQYEFVTANLNGSRAGYSRKESVFRLDQRGVLLEEEEERQADEYHQATQQQRQQQQHQLGWQLLPLAALCLVCLLVSSSFCYCRLSEAWKQHAGHRRSSADTNATSNLGPAGSGAGTLSGRQLNGQPSPSSIGKSSMWRINSQFAGKTSGATASQQQQLEREQLKESPTLRYCLRPEASQLVGSSKAFSQSLSMRDFNLSSPPASSATLNLKSYRGSLATGKLLEQKHAGTMRARLSNLNQLANYSLAGEPVLASERAGSEQSQQETSWTTNGYAPSSACLGQNCKQPFQATTYAIPAPGNGYNAEHLAHEPLLYNNQQHFHEQPQVYQNERQDQYGLLEGNAANLEACIQQMVSQQQHARCLYSGNYNLPFEGAHQQDGQANQANQQQLPRTSACQSVLESSSGSSSGVDVGNHLDAGSTTTHSNGSSAGGFPALASEEQLRYQQGQSAEAAALMYQS